MIMEDLSSLEGPPIKDERFLPLSPYDTYDPSRGPVSPLSTTTATSSISGSISNLHSSLEDRIFSPVLSNEQPPLRTSRSQSSLRAAAAHVPPPRPVSVDGSNTTTAPFWLLVNGRLVWVEDMKLWVLWDEIEAARSYEKKRTAYPAHVTQQTGGIGQHRSHRERRGGGIGGSGGSTWKSLPPLPHEIHHLLPMTSDLRLSDNDNNSSNALQRPRVMPHYHSKQNSTTNAHLQLQWASLAGQLAPRTTTSSQREQHFVDNSRAHRQHRLPQSLQPGHPYQEPPPPGNAYYYYS